MIYRREVENLLGQGCMTKLLNHVRGGEMSDDQMRYFVKQLGELSKIDPNVLFGNHTRRMSREKDRAQDTELLEVMSDWWKCSLFEMTQDKAMNILVHALSQPEVNCKYLAKQLNPVSTQVYHCLLTSVFILESLMYT